MPRHAETRVLPFTAEQMFALVAAVDRYPEFLPWCLGSRITQKDGNVFRADMLIGFRLFREKFASRVELAPYDAIHVSYTHGPFRYLKNDWRFTAHPEGCQIDFFVDFEFRSRLLSRVVGGLFTEAVHRMVRAFESRARQIYRPDVLPQGIGAPAD